MEIRHRRNTFSFIHAAVLTSLLASEAIASEGKELQDDFARFDRAYVPALALTKMGTREASQKAMARFANEWREFDSKFRKAMPKDKRWEADFDRVGKAIADAQKHLKNGRQLAAHESLEVIREIFLEARRRNGLGYYLDYLTEFHTTVEEIVLAVKVEKPNDLQPDTIAKIRGLTKKAVRQWDEVKSAPFVKQRFGFDEKKSAQRHKLLKAETIALQQLVEALDDHDKARIVSTGKAIKPIFAKSFMLFGDFPRPAGK